MQVTDQNDSNTVLHSPIDAVYMGLELMDTDLQNVLMQQKLNTEYAKLFSYQLLRGLKVSSKILSPCILLNGAFKHLIEI